MAITPGRADQKSKDEDERSKTRRVAAASAGTRALTSQLIALYVRIPVKLFRPTRIDYLYIPRILNPYSTQPWSFATHSTFALLVNAYKQHGWSVFPNHVFPPLVANSLIGTILYATYLISVPIFTPSTQNNADKTRPLPVSTAFEAGFVAGAVQSLAAAPIDAIYTRFDVSDLLGDEEKRPYSNMWRYGIDKIKQIGFAGVFAGFSLSLVKETLGYGVFFATFELIKSNMFQWYAHRVHGSNRIAKPLFILAAGATAAITIQTVQYPLTRVQQLHLSRLETLDFDNRIRNFERMRLGQLSSRVWTHLQYTPPPSTTTMNSKGWARKFVARTRLVSHDFNQFITEHRPIVGLYGRAYKDTFRQIRRLAESSSFRAAKANQTQSSSNGSGIIQSGISKLRQSTANKIAHWLYAGFTSKTLGMLPSTSLGVIVFEIMREHVYNEDGNEIFR